jgi:hypothetical protein
MRRKRLPETTPATLSPFSIACKMGYKPVITCKCGAVLDMNQANQRERSRFRISHEHCPVTQE